MESINNVFLRRPKLKRKTYAILGILLVLVVLNQFYQLPMESIRSWIDGFRFQFGWGFVFLGAVVYAILLSIPFFPGVELGWLIIFLYGKDSVIIIYLFTLIGLMISFSVGRWLGLICNKCKVKIDRFGDSYNAAFNGLSEKIHGLFSKQICSLSLNRVLRGSQYLVLAIIINIPGNTIIGGGGGIALLSGMNKTISWKGFLFTLAIAVSPLPIMLYLGLIQVEKLLM